MCGWECHRAGGGLALSLGWREMSGSGDGLRARLVARARGVPTERDWERSAVLEPRYAPRVPDLISVWPARSTGPAVPKIVTFVDDDTVSFPQYRG